MTYTPAELSAAALDLARCDTGLFFAKGAARRRLLKHRRACIAALTGGPIDPAVQAMSDDELLAELGA